MKIRPVRAWSILGVVLLVAASAVGAAQYAFADSGGVQGHAFDVTFTKWITTSPSMAGVVGGDIGAGTFAGEIQSMNKTGDFTHIEAIYHLNGSKHSLSADLHVTQNDLAGTGTMTGEITDGWLEGGTLTGEYKVYAVCPLAETPGNSMGTLCFQGVLHLYRGPNGSAPPRQHRGYVFPLRGAADFLPPE